MSASDDNGRGTAPVYRHFGLRASDKLAYLGLPYEVQALPDRLAALENLVAVLVSRQNRLEKCLRRAANLRRAAKEQKDQEREGQP